MFIAFCKAVTILLTQCLLFRFSMLYSLLLHKLALKHHELYTVSLADIWAKLLKSAEVSGVTKSLCQCCSWGWDYKTPEAEIKDECKLLGSPQIRVKGLISVRWNPLIDNSLSLIFYNLTISFLMSTLPLVSLHMEGYFLLEILTQTCTFCIFLYFKFLELYASSWWLLSLFFPPSSIALPLPNHQSYSKLLTSAMLLPLHLIQFAILLSS